MYFFVSPYKLTTKETIFMTQVVSSKPNHETFVARFFAAPSQSKSIGNFEVDLFFRRQRFSLSLFFFCCCCNAVHYVGFLWRSSQGMRLALSALLIFETCFSVFFFKIEASDFFGFRFRLKSDQTLSALQMACGCMAKKVTNMGFVLLGESSSAFWKRPTYALFRGAAAQVAGTPAADVGRIFITSSARHLTS